MHVTKLDRIARNIVHLSFKNVSRGVSMIFNKIAFKNSVLYYYVANQQDRISSSA